MTLGETLKSLRVQQKLKLTVVARELGISYRYLFYIEKDQRKPGRTTFLKLCKILGCKPEELPE